MTEPAANEAATALSAGARLAQARERLGMSLEQVADKLKLDPHTVAALEAGDYRVIGAAVFVRGFLRRYAQLVGDSPAEIEALYARQPEASQAPDLARVTVHSERRSRPRKPIRLLPAALVVVLLLAGGTWWWAGHRAARAVDDSVVDLGPATAAGPAAAPAGANAPGAPGAAAGSSSVATTPGSASAVPAPAAAQAPPAALTPEEAAAALAAKLAALPRKHLELRINDESWIEAYDARGMRLQFGFAHAGTTLALAGTPPFRLVLGNAGAVEISLEGTAVSLPAAAPGARLRVSINSKGVVTLRP